ncbi:MAG: GerAB/ArcD/ProY family transporter [Clostridiales bacterium]|nr:GerAB/ArcD/ProY family transporter [Clostridiales bacterium]
MNSATQQQSNTQFDSEATQNAGATNTRETKQTTGKQLVAIIFILAMATKMFLLPIFLIQATGRDGYIILSVYGAFDLITLIPMLIAIRICDVDIFELLSSVLGRVGAKIAVVFIWLFLLFKLNTAVSEILTFYGTNVLSDFNTSMMLIVLLAFLAATGAHTLRALSRLNEILVPVIVLCLAVLVAIVIMTGFDLCNIFPAVADKKGFSDALVKHPAWVGDFTPLLLFIGRTKTKKHTWCFAAGSGVIGTTVAVFFAIALSAAFGNVPTYVDASTNISNILQFSVGNVYGRLDMFSSILWSVSVFIEAALFFYATCRCASFVVGKPAHLVISLCTCVIVYVVQVFALTDPMIFSVAVTSKLCAIATPILAAVLPLLALVCAVVYNTKHKKPSAEEEQNAGE